MRWLIAAILVLGAATGAALLLQQYPGYVYLEVGRWTIETSLAFLIAALVVLFVIVYLALRALALVVRTPRAWRRGKHGRRTERAREGLTRGLIEMAEGRWAQAEKLLTRNARESDVGLLHYLAAARAAQQAGAYDRRDAYLKAAIEANPDADIAVSLTQAELQIAHHQTEHALATLNRLRGLAPEHSYVMKLLARLYADLEDWASLGELLPELRRRRVLPRDRLETLERAAALGRLEQAPADGERLRALWDGLSKRVRDDPDVIHACVERLIAAGAHDTAEKRLRQALARQWDERLVRAYGRVRHPDPGRQLELAESWAKTRGRNPVLLLTLGRLCARNQLWGKARSYLEASLEVQPLAETYYELARLLDELGETEAARAQYRAGLAAAIEAEDHDAAARDARIEARTAVVPSVGAAPPAEPAPPA